MELERLLKPLATRLGFDWRTSITMRHSDLLIAVFACVALFLVKMIYLSL